MYGVYRLNDDGDPADLLIVGVLDAERENPADDRTGEDQKYHRDHHEQDDLHHRRSPETGCEKARQCTGSKPDTHQLLGGEFRQNRQHKQAAPQQKWHRCFHSKTPFCQ